MAQPQMPNATPALSTQAPVDGIVRYMVLGLTVAVGLLGGLGAWGMTAELAGAVLAEGTVVVDGNVKKVQHQAGGIVGQILVKDGDRANVGDLLVRLDDTVTRANLAVITKQLDEISMRQARLKAERDGADAVTIPAALASRQNEPDVGEIIAGEQSLHKSRRQARASQAAQLRERIDQLREEIAGLTGQHAAKTTEGELVKQELVGLEQLEKQRLISTNRITVPRREAARLQGERSQLTANIAQARGKIAETELQLVQWDHDFRTEVVKELRDLQTKEGEYAERRIAAEDQLKRIDIRSPHRGVVHQMTVHTVGGVINPSEAIMLIVPENERLVIEAKIAPKDIEQVHIGQIAFIRLTAYNQRTTPELNASVARIAADLTRDVQTGFAYYVVRLAIGDEELARAGATNLLAGMPAEVQIKTSERTALSYLVKPLHDQIMKAFKER
jgi:HlyD family secretion protein